MRDDFDDTVAGFPTAVPIKGSQDTHNGILKGPGTPGYFKGSGHFHSF